MPTRYHNAIVVEDAHIAAIPRAVFEAVVMSEAAVRIYNVVRYMRRVNARRREWHDVRLNSTTVGLDSDVNYFFMEEVQVWVCVWLGVLGCMHTKRQHERATVATPSHTRPLGLLVYPSGRCHPSPPHNCTIGHQVQLEAHGERQARGAPCHWRALLDEALLSWH